MPTELVSPGEGLVTGAAALMPALPSSVAPRGIPARPTDDVVGKGDESSWLSAQDSVVFRESPPPSNSGVGEEALPGLLQAVIPVPCEGVTGLMPGVASSVAPSGMPAGRVDRIASGDVTPMPVAAGISGAVTCPLAGIGQAVPIISNANNKAIAIVRETICCAWLFSEKSCIRICVLSLDVLVPTDSE